MTRSEAYETRGKGGDNRDLAWELPEGLWPAEQRQAIQPPPAALWQSLSRAARGRGPIADLPVPPRFEVAPPPSDSTPAWSGHVDSFFAPRQSGTWVCGTGSDSAPLRPPPRPVPIPPAPKIASAPPRAREPRVWPPESARLRLHLEEERDAGVLLDRRLFGLPLRRSARACGAVLLGAALIGMASDWSPMDGGAMAWDGASSTALNAAQQASEHPESRALAPLSTSPDAVGPAPSPGAVTKRTLNAGVARGAFRHRARARRAERAIAWGDSVREAAALAPAFGADDADESAAERDVEPMSPEGTPTLDAETVSADDTGDSADLVEGSPALDTPPPALAQRGRTVTRAALISRPRPRYPDDARKRGLDGTVVVRFKIDARGAVRDAEIEHSSPAGVFDRAALHAIENTRYRPRTEDGEAVMTPKVRKRFTFHVRNRSQ